MSGRKRDQTEAYGRRAGDLQVEGRSSAVRATDAVVEAIEACRPTTTEDDEAAAEGIAAMKGAIR